MKIHLAFSADDNYAQHLTVVIYSLLQVSSPDDFYEIHILNGGISQKNILQIEQSLKGFTNKKLNFYKVSKTIFKNNQKILHLNETSYFRILLPDILTNIDKVLYLDCDLLIFEDLSKLYLEKLSPQEFIACVQIFHPNYQKVLLRQFKTKIDFCFNTGVMLIDLKKMRAANLTKKLLDFALNNSKKLLTADQDVFNILMVNKVKQLDPRWNVGSYVFFAKNHSFCQLKAKKFAQIKNSPGIIHFDGAKPWSFANNHPYKRQYFAILDQTLFKSWRPKFDLKSLIANYSFYLATKFMNLLPNKIYKFVEFYYLKNNFLEKRYRESNL